MSQYIGARYVPKFMGTYDNTQAYENMVVVDNGLGTSYISKVPVPAGTPLTDTDYWAIYGASSGAIVNLQNQIGDLNDLVTTDKDSLVDAINEVAGNLDNVAAKCNHDRIIFIGDSYGLDSEVPDGTAWPTKIAPYFDNATFLIQGGTGFASDLIPLDNWLDKLTAYVGTLTGQQKLEINQIIIVGGANDANLISAGTLNETTLESRIAAFTTYAKANLPNAIVKCAFVGWYRIYSAHPAYITAARVYSKHIADNYSYYAAGENIMRCISFIETSLNIHPMDIASQYLAAFVCSVANDGDWKFEYDAISTHADPAGLTIDELGLVRVNYNGNMCTIQIIGTYYNCGFRAILDNETSIPTGEIVNLGTLTAVPVGKIDIVSGNTFIDGPQITIRVYDGLGNLTEHPAIIGIYQGSLCLKLLTWGVALTKTILIPSCSITYNLSET